MITILDNLIIIILAFLQRNEKINQYEIMYHHKVGDTIFVHFVLFETDTFKSCSNVIENKFKEKKYNDCIIISITFIKKIK